MASGGDDGNKSSWSWGWDNIVKIAKEKTMETLEIVKSDFTEFKTTMSNDTTNLLNTATAQFVEKTNTASYLLDTFDNKVKIETNNRLKTSSTVQERYENELKSIQLSEDTYLIDPEQTEDYEKWKENFDSDANKSAISNILIENSSMRLTFSKLVPAQISNDQFWCRYFFKTNLFEEEQKKRIKLLERVTVNANDEEEETINWDEDVENEKDDNDTINNSDQSTTDKDKDKDLYKENNDTNEVTEKLTESQSDSNETGNIEEEISKEITNILIKEETTEILNEITENISDSQSTHSFEEKIVKSKSESMEASTKTEDSDDWDKVDSDINEIDNEKKKTQPKKEPKISESKENDDNNDDWDDWEE